MRRVLLLLLLATLEGSILRTSPLTREAQAPTSALQAFLRRHGGRLAGSGALACFGVGTESPSHLGTGDGLHAVDPTTPGESLLLGEEDEVTREKRLQRARIAILVLAQVADDREALDSWDPLHEDALFEIRGVDTGGVRLPNKITHADVEHLLQQLYTHKQRLHVAALDALVMQVSDVLRAERNIIYIPAGRRVTVVGDIHGSLADLHRIFQIAGWPGENSTFIFNGDFVDRGDRGVEVLGVFMLAFA